MNINELVKTLRSEIRFAGEEEELADYKAANASIREELRCRIKERDKLEAENKRLREALKYIAFTTPGPTMKTHSEAAEQALKEGNKAINESLCYGCDYADYDGNGYCYMFPNQPFDIPCAQYTHKGEREEASHEG